VKLASEVLESVFGLPEKTLQQSIPKRQLVSLMEKAVSAGKISDIHLFALEAGYYELTLEEEGILKSFMMCTCPTCGTTKSVEVRGRRLLRVIPKEENFERG